MASHISDPSDTQQLCIEAFTARLYVPSYGIKGSLCLGATKIETFTKPSSSYCVFYFPSLVLYTSRRLYTNTTIHELVVRH